MRSAVGTLFFLVIIPLGFMASEVPAAGQRTSSVQTTAAWKAEQGLLLRGNGKGGREGKRRRNRRDNDDMTDSSDVPSPAPADMEILLDLHNAARCLHDADPLAYSDTVASSAMNHARVLSGDCGSFYHSESEDRHGYGENLYVCWGTGSTTCYSPEGAMNGLYEDEIQVNDVTEYGGHATQILWKSTTELGCAVSTCDLDDPQKDYTYTYTYLVCQYNPPGNYMAIVEEQVELPSGSPSNC